MAERRRPRGTVGHADEVAVLGAGKVGRALAAALTAARVKVRLFPSRRALSTTVSRSGVVVIAVRDAEIAPVAARLADQLRARPPPRRRDAPVVVHVAGARGPEELAALRRFGVHVGQMHPLLSFADRRRPPALVGATMWVAGDREAVRAARAIAKRLGMIPRSHAGLDPVAYHAAASMVANGAAALAGAGVDLLVAGGLDGRTAARMLGPLLRSVGENLTQLGLPAALTGPVRRGDRETLQRHLTIIDGVLPTARGLYLEVVAGQLALARRLPDATPRALRAVAAWLASERARSRRNAHRSVARSGAPS